MSIKATLLASLVLCVVLDAHAAVEWTRTEQRLKPTASQDKVVTVFPFKNTGGAPVRIVSVEASCPCMVVKASKEAYAAGEAGEIRAEISVAGERGAQVRTITVTTEDPQATPSHLVVLLDLPEDIALSARTLYWTPGSAREEKRVLITLANPATTTVEGIEAKNPPFAISLDAGHEQGQYVLRVRPIDAPKLGDAAVISLKTKVTGRTQLFFINALVVTAEPGTTN